MGHFRRSGRVLNWSGVTQQSEARNALRHFGVAPSATFAGPPANMSNCESVGLARFASLASFKPRTFLGKLNIGCELV